MTAPPGNASPIRLLGSSSPSEVNQIDVPSGVNAAEMTPGGTGNAGPTVFVDVSKRYPVGADAGPPTSSAEVPAGFITVNSASTS